MRAVTGSVISSKSISLSKASVAVSRFAADRNAACPEVAAYVHRASTAFDEVVRFHREIRAGRKLSELEEPFAKGEELRRNAKSRERSRDEPEVVDGTALRAGVCGGEANLVHGDRNRHGGRTEMGGDGERKTKKRKKAAIEEERTNLVAEEETISVSNSNLVENGRHYGDVDDLLEDGRRRKKKKKKADAEETKQLGSKIELKPEVEGERHHLIENKKKLRGDIKEEHPHVAEEFGEFKEQKEKHKKRKKSRTEN